MMKKLIITLGIVLVSVMTYAQDTEYKYNPVTGNLDLVRNGSWADSSGAGLIQVDSTPTSGFKVVVYDTTNQDYRVVETTESASKITADTLQGTVLIADTIITSVESCDTVESLFVDTITVSSASGIQIRSNVNFGDKRAGNINVVCSDSTFAEEYLTVGDSCDVVLPTATSIAYIFGRPYFQASGAGDRPLTINSSESAGQPLTWYGRRSGYSWYVDITDDGGGDIATSDVPFFNVNTGSDEALVGIGQTDSRGANVKPEAWNHGTDGTSAMFSVVGEVGLQMDAADVTMRVSSDSAEQTGNILEVTTENVTHLEVQRQGQVVFDTIKDYERGLKRQVGDLINPPHAWMRFADSSVTVDQTQNTWYQVTNAGDSLFRVLELSGGFTFDGDTLFVPEAGHYIITFTLGLDVGSNNNAEIRVNTSDDGEISKMVGGSGVNGQYDAVPCNAYWTAEAGGKVWFEYRNISDNDDFTLISSIVTIVFLHP